jgi:hypothetical protein
MLLPGGGTFNSILGIASLETDVETGTVPLAVSIDVPEACSIAMLTA